MQKAASIDFKKSSYQGLIAQAPAAAWGSPYSLILISSFLLLRFQLDLLRILTPDWSENATDAGTRLFIAAIDLRSHL